MNAEHMIVLFISLFSILVIAFREQRCCITNDTLCLNFINGFIEVILLEIHRLEIQVTKTSRKLQKCNTTHIIQYSWFEHLDSHNKAVFSQQYCLCVI
jgi:hypothetical protein